MLRHLAAANGRERLRHSPAKEEKPVSLVWLGFVVFF
jgi:hypothetical protein